MSIDPTHLHRHQLTLTTWMSASLVGGITNTGTRITKKRRFVDELLASSDDVAIQEAMYTQSDLTTLPPPHSYRGTSVSTVGTSACGGSFIVVRARLRAKAIAEHTQVHMQRRARTMGLLFNSWYHFCAPLEPAASSSQTCAGTFIANRHRILIGRLERHTLRRDENDQPWCRTTPGYQPCFACRADFW